jgi:hypothetical protein
MQTGVVDPSLDYIVLPHGKGSVQIRKPIFNQRDIRPTALQTIVIKNRALTQIVHIFLDILTGFVLPVPHDHF